MSLRQYTECPRLSNDPTLLFNRFGFRCMVVTVQDCALLLRRERDRRKNSCFYFECMPASCVRVSHFQAESPLPEKKKGPKEEAERKNKEKKINSPRKTPRGPGKIAPAREGCLFPSLWVKWRMTSKSKTQRERQKVAAARLVQANRRHPDMETPRPSATFRNSTRGRAQGTLSPCAASVFFLAFFFFYSFLWADCKRLGTMKQHGRGGERIESCRNPKGGLCRWLDIFFFFCIFLLATFF